MMTRPRCLAWRTQRAEPGQPISECCGRRRAVRGSLSLVFGWPTRQSRRMGNVDGRGSARTPQEGAALQVSRSHSGFRILEHRSHPCGVGRTARARCSAPRAAIARGRTSLSSQIGPCGALIRRRIEFCPTPTGPTVPQTCLYAEAAPLVPASNRRAASLPVVRAIDGEVTAVLNLP